MGHLKQTSVSMVVLFVLVVCFTQVIVGDESSACSDPWKSFGDSCYTLVESAMPWVEAVEVCERFDGHLADVSTQGENDFIKHLVRSQNKTDPNFSVWLGGNDLLKEGEWRWMSDGRLLTFTDWYPTDPNNAGNGEDCIEMYAGQNNQLSWLDAYCSHSLYFICEHLAFTNPGFGK